MAARKRPFNKSGNQQMNYSTDHIEIEAKTTLPTMPRMKTR
jgi:hypothetical protein